MFLVRFFESRDLLKNTQALFFLYLQNGKTQFLANMFRCISYIMYELNCTGEGVENLLSVFQSKLFLTWSRIQIWIKSVVLLCIHALDWEKKRISMTPETEICRKGN